MIWRVFEGKPSEFLAAMQIPTEWLNFFLDADAIFGIIERQRVNNITGSPATPLDAAVKKAKASKGK